MTTEATENKRIRTVYFWTKKQLDDAKESAEELYKYFQGGEAPSIEQPKLSADQIKWIKLTSEIAEKAGR
jgi:general stress protein 26